MVQSGYAVSPMKPLQPSFERAYMSSNVSDLTSSVERNDGLDLDASRRCTHPQLQPTVLLNAATT
jgi:hypothetical protein